MSEQLPVTVTLSHNAAMVVVDILVAYFYGDGGPMHARLTPIQAHAASELLIELERVPAVSPISLGDGYAKALGQAEADILAEIEGRLPWSVKRTRGEAFNPDGG